MALENDQGPDYPSSVVQIGRKQSGIHGRLCKRALLQPGQSGMRGRSGQDENVGKLILGMMSARWEPHEKEVPFSTMS
jgi:hypothetical protein